MYSIWLKAVLAAALSLLMMLAFASCGDDGKTVAPTEVQTEAPTSSSSTNQGDEAEEFVLNGSDGLSYAANSAGTTCYMDGLGGSLSFNSLFLRA